VSKPYMLYYLAFEPYTDISWLKMYEGATLSIRTSAQYTEAVGKPLVVSSAPEECKIEKNIGSQEK